MAQYRQSGVDRFAARGQLDSAAAGDYINIKIPHKPERNRRSKPPDHRLPAAAAFAITILIGSVLSLLAFHRFSGYIEITSRIEGGDGEKNKLVSRPRLNRTLAFKELSFGHFPGGSGRDSTYWDRDDRRRDDDYNEDISIRNTVSDAIKRSFPEDKSVEKVEVKRGGLYNELGRLELDSYRKKYEDFLKNGEQSREDEDFLKNGEQSREDFSVEQGNTVDEYDDDINEQDEREEGGDTDGDDEMVSTVRSDGVRSWGGAEFKRRDASSNASEKATVVVSRNMGGASKGSRLSGSEKKAGLKRKPKHHKSSRSSCEIKFLNSTAQLMEPLENKKFSRFLLQYTEAEDRPSGVDNWEPRFSGHQAPQDREKSFYARDQKINCGFIKGPSDSPSTGFDIAEDDMRYMSSCHIAVSSCIFGNSDHLRTPFLKTITRQSRKNVCFIMFVDESTLRTLLSESQKLDSMGFIGLWKIVVVRNLPYPDMRRVGKVPKFLAHRLFPSARYSIWLDSKLRLQSDPYLILEYVLWRRGYEYAISNHYDRHCVWEEVVQNKRLNKYNHTVIDQQFAFYQADGLKRFDPSDDSKLLPSYVPEGSFIVRAHTPMSNLFSCLWFNEVDHWTPRDQLSFAYTYLKLRRMNPGKNFHLNMFKDCERRSIAKLFRHRAEDKQSLHTHNGR